MVEIAKCRLCDEIPQIDVDRPGASFFMACENTGCVCGPSRPTEAEAIAAWNALMSRPPPAPEPAAGTVRVRIPVKVYANGYMHISWSRFEAGSQVASGSTEAIGAIITADIPLPQPVEIPGTVESEE